ncbi:hypothetical protein NDN16_17615 [Aureimonas altamirensis]|uniref:hypothetical protein n=1 Tax=Aureimonas altamirensis TaxID=370622 RepID=UPI00203718C5|nr:hypothetical protein [Aureimonas altamirensis]MCM2505488.1 hypothetical protein [Aureimonas altamirensis]
MRAATLRHLLLAATMATAGHGTLAQDAPDAAGQRVDIRLIGGRDPAGGWIRPGETVQVEVRMIDLVSNQPVPGLHPAGFIRRADARRPDCREAAQAYRATGRVALGDIDLSGVALLVVQADGMLASVDPSMNLASANIRWLAPAGAKAPPLIDASSGTMIVDAGRARLLDAADGALTDLPGLEPGARVLAFAAAGRIAYAAESDGGFLAYDLAARRVAQRFDTVPDALATAEGGGALAVLAAGGKRLFIFDAADGRALATHELEPAATALAYSAPAAAFLLAGGPSLAIIHADAPAIEQRAALSGHATRLALSADRKAAIAYDPASGLINVVDLVSQRLVQGLQFPEGIAGIATTFDMLAVLLADRWAVAGISTDSLKAGRPPNVTQILLADQGRPPSAFPGPLMATVGELGPVLVAQPATREVYVMPHEPGMRAPTNSVAIRGGEIAAIGVQARSFVQEGESYRTSVSIPRPGRYEAVISAGLFRAAACLAFDVGPPQAAPPPPPRLTLTIPEDAASGQTVTAVVSAPPAARGAIDLHVLSAGDNFQEARSAGLSSDGLASFSLRFPHDGMFIVSATLRDGATETARAVDQIEIRP